MSIIGSRSRLLSATALACGSVAFGAPDAEAQCVISGDTGTCSGSTEGIAAPAAGDLTLTVNTGAQVRAFGPSYNAAITFDGNTGDKTLVMQTGSRLDAQFRSSGNVGTITVNNSGYINGFTVTGGGTRTVNNLSGGVLNTATLQGGINFVTNEGSIEGSGLKITDATENTIIHRGTFKNSYMSQGTSKDPFSNYGNLVGAGVLLGGGDDVFTMFSGTVDNSVKLEDGNDLATIEGGTINPGLEAGAGDDVVTWNGGVLKSWLKMDS
jgi:hypothetical protein